MIDDFLTQPPSTNRGVVNTWRSGLSACLDWVQVTFKKISSAKNIMDILGLGNDLFSFKEGGFYGWKSTYETAESEIRIFESPEEEEKGTHLIISGKGCRLFEEKSSNDWVIFFGVIFNTDINVKRIDIAIDDFKGYYNPSKLYRKIKQGAVTSRFRKGRWIESFNLSDSKNDGCYSKLGTTLYIGSPKSSIQIRVYDKLQERQEKGFIIDQNINHWVRTEIQLRDERAEGLAIMIANDYKSIGALAVGVLKNYISFKIVNKKESNKSRWKDCKWWLDFLGDTEAIALTLNHSEPTLERSVDWANTQWLKTMYSMYLVFNQDIDMFYDMMSLGQAKMEKKDYEKIEKFFDKYGSMTFEEYLKKKKNEPINDSLI